MVSIARGVSVSSGGGVFLSSDSSANGDDEECHLSFRNTEDFDGFKPLHTWHIMLLQLIIAVSGVISHMPVKYKIGIAYKITGCLQFSLSSPFVISTTSTIPFIPVGIELSALLLYFLSPSTLGNCEPFYTFIYIHAVFWLIVLIIHNFLRLKHHVLRIRGYVDFYKEIATSGKITFYIVSACNTLILVILTVFCQNYEDLKKQCESGSFLKPYEYLLGIITIENILVVPYCLSYMAKVHKHNKERPIPDFRKNDWVPQNSGEIGHSAGEIGFWNVNEGYEKLIEKQADVIRCLRDRNDALCGQIIQLEATT